MYLQMRFYQLEYDTCWSVLAETLRMLLVAWMIDVTACHITSLSPPSESVKDTRDILRFDKSELASSCKWERNIWQNCTLSRLVYCWNRSTTWDVDVSSSLCVVRPTTASAVFCTSEGFLRGAVFTALPRSNSICSRSFSQDKHIYYYMCRDVKWSTI